ncbi:MAG: AarF/ABC1/UbiB kinase family protein [Verrucomicrobiota bacterium]
MAQKSIQTSRLSRSASLLGTGAKVGLNYLKYYGKKSITGNSDKTDLHQENAVAVYKTFSELKGGPLKVAQMLSIDQNLLPGPYAQEFSQAQYSAPPLSYPLVVRTFKREFKKEPLEIFDTFNPEASSGASIGQVHLAQKKGHRYAVKVQYPGVAQSLKTDLAVVKPIAIRIIGLNESDMDPYFKEVEERLLEETDYALELSRSQELTKACLHIPGLRFPRYYKELSTSKILTMDWMDGIPLDKFIETKASATVRNKIGQALWDFYHFQIHELQLFHADPHPGNFLVDGETLCPLDFGCTKRIDDDFYTKNFHLLKPSLLENFQEFSKALEALGIILPSDSPSSRETIVKTVLPSIELLARPFRCKTFNFGDVSFMRSIYEMGEQNHQNKILKDLRGQRGSPHSLYLNRAYFGLYSLLARLQAHIKPSTPAWILES